MKKRGDSETTSKFRIQLLSNKSIVLVEASGYESEIFLPRLKNNRIGMINVIYSRQPKVQTSDTRLCANRNGHRRLITRTAGLSPDQIPVSKVSSQGPQFELKLISNGNVVLVECNGYESEIFLPLISSRCVALKRVSAYELTQYAHPKNTIEHLELTPKNSDKAAAMAASLAAQAVGLTKLLVYLPLQEKGTKEKSVQCKEKAKRWVKQQSKSAGDAKITEHPKYRSIYSNTS